MKMELEIQTTDNIHKHTKMLITKAKHNLLGKELQNEFLKTVLNKKYVARDSLLDFIKGYENSLGDLPKELQQLKVLLNETE